MIVMVEMKSEINFKVTLSSLNYHVKSSI